MAEKKKKEPSLKLPCGVCNVIHKAGIQGTYVIIPRFGSEDMTTTYICSKTCYDKWKVQNCIPEYGPEVWSGRMVGSDGRFGPPV